MEASNASAYAATDDGMRPLEDAPSVTDALGALEEELHRLKAATLHIETSQEAARKATEAAKSIRASAEDLATAIDALVSRIAEVDFPSRLSALGKHLKDAKAETSDVRREVNGLQSRIGDQARQLDRLGQQAEKMGEQVNQVRKEVRLDRTSAF